MVEGILFPVESGCAENPSHMVSYRLCSDGIYLQKKVGCGFVTVKVEGIGGTPKGVEKIDVLPRKLPIDVYHKTVRFFRDVESKFGAKGTEAYVIVAYDTKEDNFFLYVPKQQVGAASVKYDISGFHTIYPNGVIIMDIHSHTSSMGAFWSGVNYKVCALL